ncbi:hypothetical protein M011DRAFT_467770 [Sporormia fimetaria CBS 119925]|uniref:Uncharacterized protein n=1 Tax=Sporormia fimetaria CBS 119925 TaxID=1340428 RepID=A0A6A6VBH1_9PLEO|nr:hypothetical protein M011DRAFT_467770 [Sporormia fimetaria CBS 119925]
MSYNYWDGLNTVASLSSAYNGAIIAAGTIAGAVAAAYNAYYAAQAAGDNVEADRWYKEFQDCKARQGALEAEAEQYRKMLEQCPQ